MRPDVIEMTFRVVDPHSSGCIFREISQSNLRGRVPPAPDHKTAHLSDMFICFQFDDLIVNPDLSEPGIAPRRQYPVSVSPYVSLCLLTVEDRRMGIGSTFAAVLAVRGKPEFLEA